MACVRKRRGKWMIDYRDPFGKRCWETVQTNKKEAEALLAQRLLEIQKGGFNPNRSKMPFLEYAQKWLGIYADIHLKPSTLIGYRRVLKLYIFPVFGEAPLNAISRDMVKMFLADLAKKGLAFNYIRIAQAVLRVILSHALEDGLIQTNPARGVGKFVKDRSRTTFEINPFTQEELSLFLRSVGEHFPEFFPFFMTLARTGMRLGEAIGLQWGDIDFQGGFIEIRRGIVNGKVETPKSGKPRKVDMSRQLAHVLSDHFLEMKKLALRKGWGEVPEWVFCNRDGTPLNGQNVRVRIFFKVIQKAGLRRVRIHDLRHAFATLLIQNGESLAYIRDQLGHHSIKITVDTYGHLVPGGNRQAVDRLDDPQFQESGSKMVATGSLGRKGTGFKGQRDLENSIGYKRNMVGAAGFEPATT